MRFKEVIIVVLIMIICAIAMLIYIIISDSIEASSVPIIGNIVENIEYENREDMSKKNATNETKYLITVRAILSVQRADM